MSGEWVAAPERLDRALVTLGFARSRNHAAQLVADRFVTVQGATVEKTSVKVRPGDQVEVAGPRYVSRAAQKLVDALDGADDPGIDPRGKLALDLGASTGGFTQVLLERGAARVLAVDVGHNQMVAQLRDDPRVVLVEGCNARYLTREHLAELTGVSERPEIIVADLSFISLTHVLEPIANIAAPGADIVLLIKPQFEVGKSHIGDGVVTSPELQRQAVAAVLEAAKSHGLIERHVRPTSVIGTHGNQEFVAHLSAPGPLDREE